MYIYIYVYIYMYIYIYMLCIYTYIMCIYIYICILRIMNQILWFNPFVHLATGSSGGGQYYGWPMTMAGGEGGWNAGPYIWYNSVHTYCNSKYSRDWSYKHVADRHDNKHLLDYCANIPIITFICIHVKYKYKQNDWMCMNTHMQDMCICALRGMIANLPRISEQMHNPKAWHSTLELPFEVSQSWEHRSVVSLPSLVGIAWSWGYLVEQNKCSRK